LTNNPQAFAKKINKFLPELVEITTNIKFSAHNFRGKPMNIENLNNEKIGNLSQLQLDEINEIFNEQTKLLQYFNYEIIE